MGITFENIANILPPDLRLGLHVFIILHFMFSDSGRLEIRVDGIGQILPVGLHSGLYRWHLWN